MCSAIRCLPRTVWSPMHSTWSPLLRMRTEGQDQWRRQAEDPWQVQWSHQLAWQEPGKFAICWPFYWHLDYFSKLSLLIQNDLNICISFRLLRRKSLSTSRRKWRRYATPSSPSCTRVLEACQVECLMACQVECPVASQELARSWRWWILRPNHWGGRLSHAKATMLPP